jgi:hypothetical protein
VSLVSLLPAGSSVLVGCATGVDACVRAAVRARPLSLSVFQASFRSRTGLAQRSARLVRAVWAQAGCLLVCPAGSCPVQVQPSRSFRGYGSGSWGSLALAVGLGCSCCLVLPSGVAAPGWVACRFTYLGAGVWVFQPPNL